MEKEIWKNVSEIGIVPDGQGKEIDMSVYDNFYVSTFGRIYNTKTKKFLPKEGKCYDSNNYRIIALSNYGKKINFRIHRLVAYAFLPNPNGLPQINHKDENRTNNHVENLEWCDAKYNVNYGNHNKNMIETKKIKPTKIKIKNRYKQVFQYTKEHKLVRIWNNTAEAVSNGYKTNMIEFCCNGKLKYYDGYIWSYQPFNKITIRKSYFGTFSFNGYGIKKTA